MKKITFQKINKNEGFILFLFFFSRCCLCLMRAFAHKISHIFIRCVCSASTYHMCVAMDGCFCKSCSFSPIFPFISFVFVFSLFLFFPFNKRSSFGVVVAGTQWTSHSKHVNKRGRARETKRWFLADNIRNWNRSVGGKMDQRRHKQRKHIEIEKSSIYITSTHALNRDMY